MRPYRIVIATMPPRLQGLLHSVLSVLEGADILQQNVPPDELEFVGRKLDADLAIVSVSDRALPVEGARLLQGKSLIKLMVLGEGGKWITLHVPLGELSPEQMREAIRRLRDHVLV